MATVPKSPNQEEQKIWGYFIILVFATFLTNAAWAIRSTYHTVLKASPGAAIFGRDMLFDIPSIADWNKIGDYKQRSIQE